MGALSKRDCIKCSLFYYSSVNLFLDGCDIDPFDISGYINVDNIDFFDKITEFGLGKLDDDGTEYFIIFLWYVYSFLGTSIIGMINLVMAYIFVTCLNHAAGLFFLKKRIVLFDFQKYIILLL